MLIIGLIIWLIIWLIIGPDTELKLFVKTSGVKFLNLTAGYLLDYELTCSYRSMYLNPRTAK
jgi:hypothetical protein